MRASGMATPEMKATSVYRGFQIRDGHGIVFVSNLGDIYPSGFLPLRCGNVRTGSLVDVYRNSDIFRALHSPDQFHGKCGNCEYSHICGGSRARAYAHTGDALGTDPFCAYEPVTPERRRPSAAAVEKWRRWLSGESNRGTTAHLSRHSVSSRDDSSDQIRRRCGRN